jgi:hypothetical protein
VIYSDVEGGHAGAGNIDANPIFEGAASGNYRLRDTSPCIDAGDNTTIAPGSYRDLEGKSRRIDDPNTVDTGNGTAPIVDMGAYEFGDSLILDITGLCPGNMTFIASGATSPKVAFAYSFNVGSFTIPGSYPCPGVKMSLNAPVKVLAVVNVNGGVAELSRNVPQQGCGRVYVQAIDLEPSCVTSGVVLIGN